VRLYPSGKALSNVALASRTAWDIISLLMEDTGKKEGSRETSRA